MTPNKHHPKNMPAFGWFLAFSILAAVTADAATNAPPAADPISAAETMPPRNRITKK